MASIKIYLKNFLQSIKRFYPKKHESISKYKLEKNQVYPQGKSFFLKSLENEILGTFKKHSFNLEKNISSIGTCFAEEFALFLYNSKFKYEIFEKNRFMFQSNWGRVYTPISNKLLSILFWMTMRFLLQMEKKVFLIQSEIIHVDIFIQKMN